VYLKPHEKVLAAVLVVIVAAGLYGWFWFKAQREPFSEEALARDLALQDETAVAWPEPRYERRAMPEKQPNPSKNLYFGELHLHTEQSFDSVLFGNTLTIEDAYRFAQGEPMNNTGGELMRISTPLDFVAITDHAEGFGSRRHCGEEGLGLREQLICWVVRTPNLATFKYLRKLGTKNDGQMTRESSPGCAESGLEQCLADAIADWADYQALADAHNRPGEFTAFAAYEYSPPLPDSGKFHRNIIFNGEDLPALAVSAMDAPNAISLWQQLDEHCTGNCDYLTIPHNMNRTWGLAYARKTRDGVEYQQQDWQLREKSEPLAEIYQIKGASECALGVGASDEECGFEQIFQPCEEGQQTGCAFATGFVREGLKEGMVLEQELGVNPMRFGFIGATDSHNSNPGDTEEWDARGYSGAMSSPAVRRQTHRPMRVHTSAVASRSPGGLAAVWAEENTRDALFNAMKNRETYATSGTRIRLRVQADWDLDVMPVQGALAIEAIYRQTIPMGGRLQLPKVDSTPAFYVAAQADPLGAPLQRLQMVKGWLENGQRRESVVDIACSEGRRPDKETGRCPDNGAVVDLTDCSISADTGAKALNVLWRDQAFKADQPAFYYVRVLENPSCRWSSYDALRLGIEPTEHAPATIQERAWGSPIWYSPAATN
jgi:hypothetical protein